MASRESQPSLPSGYLDFLPDPDAIEQRPLAGVTHWVLIALSALLVILLLWAGLSEIDTVVTGRGKLVSSQPNIVVQPLETAVVQAINVRPGQVVAKGQQLAALDPTFASADASQLRGGLSSLDARTRRLEGEVGASASGGSHARDSRDEALQSQLRSARDANYGARLRALGENLARLEASLQTNRQDQQVLESRVKSLQELEQMQEKLVSQNFGAKQSLLAARERTLEVERELRLARNREVELSREIASARAERDAFQKEWRQKTIEELADARRDRDSAAQQLEKAERRRKLVSLVAPVDAVVLEIAQRSVGSVVREAEPMFTLVPLNVPLEVELQIDAADIGFVRTDQKVRVKLDAFPFQKHGTLAGRVNVVSRDAFAPSQSSMAAASAAGGQGGGAYYLARIAVDNFKLDRVDESFQPLPGMSLSGEIKVGQRSVLSYFLYPIIRTLDESLKEAR